jgi:hypothetical protein
VNKRFVGLALLVWLLQSCCGTPSYTPGFWNDAGTVQYHNNCYNYANNRRTDTFAQPGRAHGITLTVANLNCNDVANAAVADGLDRTAGAGCPACQTTVALVIYPGHDYHWYRRDANGLWTHKPGGTQATNLDSSGHPITNPETADRGNYTVFCGYFCICSSKTEGSGHEDIN